MYRYHHLTVLTISYYVLYLDKLQSEKAKKQVNSCRTHPSLLINPLMNVVISELKEIDFKSKSKEDKK